MVCHLCDEAQKSVCSSKSAQLQILPERKEERESKCKNDLDYSGW